MKKTTILITALIMLFVSAPQAKASPMYYTFEGTVYSLVDHAGAIASQFGPGFGVGSPVTYTIIIDFDAPGTYRRNNGITTTYSDGSDYDIFYTDAYSGDYLVSTDGGYWNGSDNIAELNYGVDDSFAGTNGYLWVNSQNDKMYINSQSLFLASMAVGYSGLVGQNYAYHADAGPSRIGSTLTLVSISPVSVPEPSTLLLLGSGLLALGMFRRMRQEG